MRQILLCLALLPGASSVSLRGQSTTGWSGCHMGAEWAPKGDLHFIHIPRTGGTTVETCDGAFPASWNGTRWDVKYKKVLQTSGRWVGKMKGRHEAAPMLYKDEKWEQTRCYTQHVPPSSLAIEEPGNKVFMYGKNQNFCVVRSPYTRLISQFGYATQMFKENWGTKAFRYGCNKLDLNAYLLDRLNQTDVGIKNATAGGNGAVGTRLPNWGDCHFLPSAFFVYGFDARNWKTNRNEQWCDHVLHYENMEHDFNRLMTDFGYGFRIGGGAKDKNGNLQSKGVCATLTPKDLSPEVLALANSIFKEDFELFGYDKL